MSGSTDASTRVIRGETGATWALWGFVTVAMVVTYTRVDPDDLYHVSREGIVGGVSRALVAVNFPIALVAIALVLIAMDDLPRRTWWVGGPAIVLCAVTAFPGVVDDQDLDARPINVVPAIGVAIAVGLSVAAARHRASGFAPRRPLDPWRWLFVAVAVVVSVPWVLAEFGVYGPGWIFIMDRPITGSNGDVNPAVHLGHHHGFDGALFVITAALLSRRRLRSHRLRTATTMYVSLIFAYGVVNMTQDAWNEQIVKRGWSDASIPSALNPALEPIWLVILALAAVTTLVVRRESDMPVRGTSSGAADHVIS